MTAVDPIEITSSPTTVGGSWSQRPVSVQPFATNLRTPSHMEWTPEGRLLVSETTAGRIVDITDGGDFADAEPFAVGLEGPASILPLPDGRILVAEVWRGRVTDVSLGGDVSKREPYAAELHAPYSLSTAYDRIFVVERAGTSTNQSTDISGGGGRSNHVAHVRSIPTVAMAGLEGLTPVESWPASWQPLFIGCGGWNNIARIGGTTWPLSSSSALGQLIKVPEEGGSFLDLVEEGYVVAQGLGWLGGAIQHPLDERVYLTQPTKGSVVAVDPSSSDTDYRFQPPVVQGLNMPTCVRFSPDGAAMFVCSMSTGSVWKVEDFGRP